MKRASFVTIVLALAIFADQVHAQQAQQSKREAMYYRYVEFPSYVKGGSVTAHWMADGSSFWYAEGAPDNTVIWKIDPKANTKTPLFDTTRLRQAFSPLLEHEPPYQGVPFAQVTFVEGEKAAQFTVEGKEFILQLDTYAISRAPVLSEEEKSRLVPEAHPSSWDPMREVPSPDGRWFAGTKENNLWLRSTSDGRSVQLTSDGVKDYEWGHDVWHRWTQWSPDNSRLAVGKIDLRQMTKIPLVHYLKPREEVEWVVGWDLFAEEPMPQTELFIVEIPSKRKVRLNTGTEPDYFLFPRPGWRPDGSELLFYKMSPDWKKLELMASDPKTGATQVVLAETQKTFVVGIENIAFGGWVYSWLPDGNRFIWMSERDGWRHLYLYNLDGTLIRRLTQGAFPVVEVVAVDDKAGWVYFTVHAEQQRPYDTHLYRANLEGQGFTRLTEAEGQHAIQFAPSKEFYLDTHSSVDGPPVVELRRADGTLVQILSKANIDALKELQWKPPEEFVVKAADGKTDLYGVLYKPYDFDPNKKYPVVEAIYAGPWIAVVPRTFILGPYPLSGPWPLWNQRVQAIAQLGFIVFIVDGRGTPERGKAFQDVVYRNYGRNEIPDHVATLKQLAEKRSYMDLSRVGILGHSMGGYFAIRAMLLAPDVYHVGIAASAELDGSASFYWMERPKNNREGYEYASNLRLAGNLKGKLLLIHGTSDEGFSNTMKMVDALIRAAKPYDLIVLPEGDHMSTVTATYSWEAIRRYFQEYLKP